MQIKMDTDAVRSMSSKFRQTADSMDASLASIKATVESAGWQSQAREEFILRLEMLRRTSTQSATVLRMMAQAADRKAEQWEAIANVFNGPFHSMGNIWSSVIAFFSGIGGSIWNAIASIRLPSLPRLVFPSISAAAVIGGIASIIPKWEWNSPDWWPFGRKGEYKFPAGVAGGGDGGGSWGDDKKDKETSTDSKNVQNINNQESEEKYVGKYDGNKPAPGMDSTYGKPGQLPLDAPVTSSSENRSPELYEDVINQFAVGNNPRYTPDKNGNTFCNTYAGDVARAMGVPFPQKNEFGMNPKDKATIGFPQLYDFFTDQNAPVKASDLGWREISKNNLAQLESHVNQGKMAVLVNNGHIAVVKPGQSIENFNNIQISQAGATNSNQLSESEGFGSTSEPKIFIID